MDSPSLAAPLPRRIVKPADQLTPGDRISAAFMSWHGGPCEVMFVYQHEKHGEHRVFVAFVSHLGYPDSTEFLAIAKIPLEYAAPAITQADIDAAKFAGGMVAAATQAYDDLGERLNPEAAPVPDGVDGYTNGQRCGVIGIVAPGRDDRPAS